MNEPSPLILNPYDAALSRMSYLPKENHPTRPYAVSYAPVRLFPREAVPKQRHDPTSVYVRRAESLIARALQPLPWDAWYFKACPKDTICPHGVRRVNLRPPYPDELLLWAHKDVQTVIVVDLGDGHHLREGVRTLHDHVPLTRGAAKRARELLYARKSKAIEARNQSRGLSWDIDGTYLAFARMLKLRQVWMPTCPHAPKNEWPESANFPAENKNALLKDYSNESTAIG